MRSTRPFLLAVMATVTLLAGCAQVQSLMAKAPQDGELAAPADYRSWPKFLSHVQRPDAKQVREIYMNPVAAKANATDGFPNGSVFVMENYAAVAKPDGSLQRDPGGQLVKGNLLRVFVMGKGDGWGRDVPEALRTGDWIYAAYLPSGEKAPDPIAACRACHLPLKATDFVPRYYEHFNKKAAGLPEAMHHVAMLWVR